MYTAHHCMYETSVFALPMNTHMHTHMTTYTYIAQVDRADRSSLKLRRSALRAKLPELVPAVLGCLDSSKGQHRYLATYVLAQILVCRHMVMHILAWSWAIINHDSVYGAVSHIWKILLLSKCSCPRQESAISSCGSSSTVAQADMCPFLNLLLLLLRHAGSIKAARALQLEALEALTQIARFLQVS